MLIAIASDHGGVRLKKSLVKALESWGIEVCDLGTHDDASCDYPDYAHQLACGLEQGHYELGVLICGTGVGMSIAANRHPSVRAAVVSDTFSARLCREHNHANVLCMGERVVGIGLAQDILQAWLHATPDTDPRHMRRIDKINRTDCYQ